jgi:hypothetical protein
MGKRSTSKHAASARRVAAARLRRLLVAAVCGGLVFAVSGYVLEAATMVTRVLIAAVVTLVGYTGLALAKARPGGAPAGRRRAIAAAPAVEEPDVAEDAEPSFVDADVEDVEPSLVDADVEPSFVDVDAGLSLFDADGEIIEDAEPSFVDADTDVTEDVEEDETPHAPVLFLEQLIQQAMAEELANAQSQDESDEVSEDQALELAHAHAADVVLPDLVMHDLVPISSLIEARAEAERVSLQRIQATVRGLSVRTGDDPVAVDVLARVVAAVDRLMVPESFERPVLSETGPLLAEIAAAPQAAAPPPQEATPLPAVPAMRPSDMPVTELTTKALSEAAIAEELPEEAPEPETQPIDAVVVDDPDLVLPIPAPPRPQPAPRGRRLRRNSVA